MNDSDSLIKQQEAAKKRTRSRVLLAFVFLTVLGWLAGAYVEYDWIWFAHIERPEHRLIAVGTYLFSTAFILVCFADFI